MWKAHDVVFFKEQLLPLNPTRHVNANELHHLSFRGMYLSIVTGVVLHLLVNKYVMSLSCATCDIFSNKSPNIRQVCGPGLGYPPRPEACNLILLVPTQAIEDIH